MSKVLIDRELLERAVYRLELAYDADAPIVCDLSSVLAAPSGTPAMPVKAYYHEAPNEYGGLNKSVGLEVRKEFTDAPLVLEADAMECITYLEGEIAKRDARIDELESRYQRDVYGLNNEGDPIGGDPAGGYANDNARLRTELAAIKAQEPAVDEQAAFEDWIARVCPSGDCSSVTEQWLASSDYADLYAAPVSGAKAQGVVMPDVNAAAKALCNRHAAICGVDADDQWKEYSQDFIADAETVLANSRLCAATVLEVNAHCAVIPEPYGWVAAGSFYTDRESAICAAEKTPCIDVYSRPQMNALENRSLQRQELAEELARQLNASCAEIRNMRNLYAAPVSEAKAQGVVQWPDADEIMQMAFEEGQPADDASGYCFELEEFDLFIERLMSEVARLNAAPAQQVVPDGSTKMQWPEIVALVNEVLGCEAHKYPCERGSIGHEMTGINFNSLARIIDRVRYAAAPAAPAADAGLVAVEWAKDAEEWGPALNKAGWLFLSELNEDPQKSALIFNSTKGPLRAAIMKYAEIVTAHRANGVV